MQTHNYVHTHTNIHKCNFYGTWIAPLMVHVAHQEHMCSWAHTLVNDAHSVTCKHPSMHSWTHICPYTHSYKISLSLSLSLSLSYLHTLQYSEMHMQTTRSVESTPVHTTSLQPTSPGKNDSGRRSPSISSLFDSGSSKRSIFKKLFGRKPSATKQRSMTVILNF